MRDALSPRAKFGVVCPSTNSVVEADYCGMGIQGVTCHFARITVANPVQGSDEQFDAVMRQIREDLPRAVERVMDVEPDHLILAVSAESFWGGAEGNQKLKARISEATGLPVATGAEAIDLALRAMKARRVAVLTPYQPIGDREVARFLVDLGYEPVRVHGLKCASTRVIAHVPEHAVRDALRALDGDDVDALLQVGTNLSAVRVADEAERWLGKPVIAINAATWWMALRAKGIRDQLDGFGTLLREF